MERSNKIIDDAYTYAVAASVMTADELSEEPLTVDACRRRTDWPQWKKAIQDELDSLAQRKVFGPVVPTPKHVQPIGHRWVFVRKRDERGEIARYKARLVAQGFLQKPGVDYEQTYSPVMDAITFRFLISLAVQEDLDMHLMDVVTAYLYGLLDAEIHMRVPEGIRLPEAADQKSKHMYSIRLNRSLYGLKQSGRMWYQRLRDFLVELGYKTNDLCPCIFIKVDDDGIAMIAVYVDDLNLIGHKKALQKTAAYLKKEFEMKDLGETKFCLGFQIERFAEGTLVHQSTYTRRLLERFGMSECKPLSTPMQVRSLDVDTDPFRPLKAPEVVLGEEYPYLAAIGALMYLSNCTRPDIAFAVNCLARSSSSPTMRHWKGVKHIFRYLKGTVDMGLLYQKVPKDQSALVGYADASYLSDPHKARSQTGYVFTSGGTAISWRSTKQTLVTTSSNHAELIAIYEASKELFWLRSISEHVRGSCGMSVETAPTTLREDNTACIRQLEDGYIKGDKTKHISPKFWYTSELQDKKILKIEYVKSEDNIADFFTKALPAATFERLRAKIGMKRAMNLRASK
jgi:hypothetical protein